MSDTETTTDLGEKREGDDGGYRYCACRDCSQVTMTTGYPAHDFCSDCRDTCDRDSECQSDSAHTYCEGDERSNQEHWQAAEDSAPIFTGDDARSKAAAYANEHSIKGLRQYCGACGQEY